MSYQVIVLGKVITSYYLSFDIVVGRSHEYIMIVKTGHITLVTSDNVT